MALVLLGCSPATEIVVVVDSDFIPVTEIAAVEATVAPTRAPPVTHRFDIAEVGLPFSFGISPDHNDYNGIVLVSVRALTAEGTSLVVRRARVNFVSGRAIRLDIPLSRSCSGLEQCPGNDTTCEAGVCVSNEISGESLPDAPSGTVPRLFDGPSLPADAGQDAGPDGGSCVEDEPCSPPRSCMTGEMRCAGEPACEVTAMLPTGAPCGAGRTCDAVGRCGQ